MSWTEIPGTYANPNGEEHRLLDGMLMVAAISRLGKGWHCLVFPPGKPTQATMKYDLAEAKTWAEETLKQTRIEGQAS
jgi:hypothetical protein